jgi:hypothetical protein
MKVFALIELLQTLDQTAEVILARDPEGNGFSTTTDFSTGWWDGDEEEYRNMDEVEVGDEDWIAAVLLWPDR